MPRNTGRPTIRNNHRPGCPCLWQDKRVALFFQDLLVMEFRLDPEWWYRMNALNNLMVD